MQGLLIECESLVEKHQATFWWPDAVLNLINYMWLT